MFDWAKRLVEEKKNQQNKAILNSSILINSAVGLLADEKEPFSAFGLVKTLPAAR